MVILLCLTELQSSLANSPLDFALLVTLRIDAFAP
jgi:hypothetical protein